MVFPNPLSAFFFQLQTQKTDQERTPHSQTCQGGNGGVVGQQAVSLTTHVEGVVPLSFWTVCFPVPLSPIQILGTVINQSDTPSCIFSRHR
jgi:hypothetical protein